MLVGPYKSMGRRVAPPTLPPLFSFIRLRLVFQPAVSNIFVPLDVELFIALLAFHVVGDYCHAFLFILFFFNCIVEERGTSTIWAP